MIVTVFQSGKGDSLLVQTGNSSNKEKKNILVDGGLSHTYKKHVAPFLNKMFLNGEKLDLVYVSHIDQDHIGGVLQMIDDLVDWRVYEYKKDEDFRPGSLRPPNIHNIWHNAFHEQVSENVGDISENLAAQVGVIEEQLTSLSQVLSVSDDTADQEHGNLMSSISEAIKLSKRIHTDLLNIPLNPVDSEGNLVLDNSTHHENGKLIYLRDNIQKVSLGSFNITIIGPLEKALIRLRKDWNKWLNENRKRIKAINSEARIMEGNLINGVDDISLLSEKQLRALGDRNKVTPPNLASLMLMIEEDGKTMLCTGDGHNGDIIEGLTYVGFLNGKGLHVDILKIQHHGSGHNINLHFVQTITADIYIFCGNGEHTNPELEVVELIALSRIDKDNRSLNPQAKNPFKFYFNSSSSASEDEKGASHMSKIEDLVETLRSKSKGQFDFVFLEKEQNYFQISPQ